MSKISKSEDGKILVDGKPLDAGDCALSDNDLKNIAGGTATSVWGDASGYATCTNCYGDEFDLIGSFGGSVLKLRCRGCGEEHEVLLLS